jgi:hypothetical protein
MQILHHLGDEFCKSISRLTVERQRFGKLSLLFRVIRRVPNSSAAVSATCQRPITPIVSNM